MADESEVDRLRAEVESYRARELAELKTALAAARAERDHYRTEAYTATDKARQIAVGYQAIVADLRRQLESKEQLSNGRRSFAKSN